MAVCIKCKQAAKVLRLVKCALCFKLICEKCAFRKYGQNFCGIECSRSFFFGTGEEYEGEL
jgi:hypothetical protein